jgi:hypothetical protein
METDLIPDTRNLLAQLIARLTLEVGKFSSRHYLSGKTVDQGGKVDPRQMYDVSALSPTAARTVQIPGSGNEALFFQKALGIVENAPLDSEFCSYGCGLIPHPANLSGVEIAVATFEHCELEQPKSRSAQLKGPGSNSVEFPQRVVPTQPIWQAVVSRNDDHTAPARTNVLAWDSVVS